VDWLGLVLVLVGLLATGLWMAMALMFDSAWVRGRRNKIEARVEQARADGYKVDPNRFALWALGTRARTVLLGLASGLMTLWWVRAGWLWS